MPNDPDPCTILIFGASGDLTARKIIPALYELFQRKALPPNVAVLGLSRREFDDHAFREHLEEWARKDDDFDDSSWNAFAKHLFYISGDATDPAAYEIVKKRLDEIRRAFDTCGNVLFYLSVAPSIFKPIVEQINNAGLVKGDRSWSSERENLPWRRIIVEKPVGHDLESAEELNRVVGRVFEENDVFRIDHYLGKELVQNLLVLRFANSIFEPIWNHRYIDHVQITAAETVGAGHRASFYDEVGAVRDMVQSHLLQVMALVAMEPPADYLPHLIRQEKVKVIDTIEPIAVHEIADCVVFGQYGAGRGHKAFHELQDVRDDTTTETFAAVMFHFDNWRWSGTPFYVRTGKRLAAKKTEVVIQFRRPPAELFRKLDLPLSRGPRVPNQVIIEIGPHPRSFIRLDAKVPGSRLDIGPIYKEFDYVEHFQEEPADAYGPLLLEAMRGDQTLFPHRYEVEGTWRAVMPLLSPASQDLRRGIHANYQPGSWGPQAADAMLARHGRTWHNDPEVHAE